MPDQKTMWTRFLGGFSVMWVTKLLISPVKKGFFAQKRPNLAQNWHFWLIWARPCRLIRCPVGGLVGGCGAWAVSRKTPIYFIILLNNVYRIWTQFFPQRQSCHNVIICINLVGYKYERNMPCVKFHETCRKSQRQWNFRAGLARLILIPTLWLILTSALIPWRTFSSRLKTLDTLKIIQIPG